MMLHVMAPIMLHVMAPRLQHIMAPRMLHVKAPRMIHVKEPIMVHVKAPIMLHVKAPIMLHVMAPITLHVMAPIMLHVPLIYFSFYCFNNNLSYQNSIGTAVAQWLRCCVANRRSLIRSQMVSLEFFIDIILPIALLPWGRLSL